MSTNVRSSTYHMVLQLLKNFIFGIKYQDFVIFYETLK